MPQFGCSKPEFQFNLVEVAVQENARGAEITTPAKRLEWIQDILQNSFGTPDEPVARKETGLDLEKIKRAAGPVGSDQEGSGHGLYRQHCARCHGLTGDGKGPVARVLNPYPRDFRRGIFKFKSTARTAKPTDEDLMRILHYGIPDTAMPSFKRLPEAQREVLVEYVKYLSIRGEMEIKLIYYVVVEADHEEPLDTGKEPLIENIFSAVAESWKIASESVVHPKTPPTKLDPPEAMEKSIARGRKLFYDTGKGNCISCHGETAQSDGETEDFDDWNKPIKPEWIALGALPRRPTEPRNLRRGVFRGGRQPLDLYRRIYAGIHGTTMPGYKTVLIHGEDDQMIWDLVNYVRNLPNEPEPQIPAEKR